MLEHPAEVEAVFGRRVEPDPAYVMFDTSLHQREVGVVQVQLEAGSAPGGQADVRVVVHQAGDQDRARVLLQEPADDRWPESYSPEEASAVAALLVQAARLAQS